MDLPPYVRRGLKIALIVLAVVVVAIAAGVFYLGSSHFSGRATQWVSAKSGRDVAFEGNIELHMGRTPRLIVHQLKVGNADWAQSPHMFTAERIEISLNPWALLRFRLELPEVIADQPRLWLEKNAEGEANWHTTQNAKSVALEAPAPDERSEIPLIGRLQISGGELTYADAGRKILTTLQISTVQGEAQANESISLSGKGSYRSQPFLLEMTGDSVLQLRETDEPYRFTLKTSVGATRAEMAGTVQDPIKLEALDIQLLLAGANAADLFPLTGIALPPTPSYEVKGRLTRDRGEARWDFIDFAGRMGSSDLSGNVHWFPEREPPYFQGDFTSKNLDMKDLAGFIGAHRAPDAPDRVIPDTKLDISRLLAMNADATFRGTHVKAPQLLDDFSLTIVLRDGVLKVQPVSFGIAKGKISADIVIEGKKNPPPVSTRVTFDRLSLNNLFGPLAKRFGEDNVTAGLLGGGASFKGHGKSLHEMLANADGGLAFGMEGGRFSRLLVELVGLDIFKSVGLVLRGDMPVTIDCIVGDFSGEKGLMKSNVFLVETGVATIRGEGTLNLKDEALDLRLNVRPKDASLISARAPILVRGRLGKPRVMPDPASLAARGGVATALGALLTPAGAMLAFIEPPSKAKDAPAECGPLIRQVNAKTSGAVPRSGR